MNPEQSLADKPESSTPQSDGDVPQVDAWTVPGVIGMELARQWEHLNAVGGDLRRTQAASRGQLRALADVARRIRYLAMQSQQLSRLAGGRLRQSHERIDLKAMIEQVAADNRRDYTARALEIDLQLQPVEVIVDPALLHSLVETGFDCVARYGGAISVWLKVSNWPEHGILEFRARERVVTAADGLPQAPDEAPESVAWVLLAQLARTTGVILRRETTAHHMSVTLEFPRTVKRLEGLTAVEFDTGEPGAMSESRPMAGHRLLLVSADAWVQEVLRSICKDMGLVLNIAPSVRQAVRLCELDKPHGLVIDERLHDKAFDELRADLLRYDINYPCVEIASAPNIVEIASWMGDGMSRISRDALRAQLPSLLVMELAKVL